MKTNARQDLYTLIRSMMLFRLIAATAFLFVGFILLESSYPFYILIGSLYFLTIVYLLVIQSHSGSRAFPYVQIAVDIIIVSCLIGVARTPDGIFLFLYLLPIISASLYYNMWRSSFVALGCGVLYTGIILGKYYSGYGGANMEKSALFSMVLMNLIIFYIVGFLSGYLGKIVSVRGDELRNLQNLHNLILDNMNSGLISADMEGRIIYSNSAAEQTTGYFSGELKGRKISDFFIKTDDRKTHFDPSEFIKKRGSQPRAEALVITKHGEEIPIGYNTSTIRDQDGNVIGSIIVFTDLRNVKRLEEKLRQADKLRAVGTLAAGIAHEIRNPLAAISGSIEMLGEIAGMDEANKRLFDVVQKESARLNLIIEGFLNYTREVAPKMQRVKTRELIEEVVLLMRNDPGISSEIRISVDTLTDDIDIFGDAMQLKQVFINLVKNAAEATSGKGEINIKISRDDESGLIDIIVSDNGCGMDDESLKHIFTPFYTTKKKGVGIGLSVAEKIVRNHGGQINVESRRNEGTRFTISLPAWSGEMELTGVDNYGKDSDS